MPRKCSLDAPFMLPLTDLMPKLWIIHRKLEHRAALARLAGLAAEDVVLGAPMDSDLDAAARPSAIVLGVGGDFELELDFAHRFASRLSGSRWILLAAPEDAGEATRLFDLVQPEILDPMPAARTLRAAIARAAARRQAESLSYTVKCSGQGIYDASYTVWIKKPNYFRVETANRRDEKCGTIVGDGEHLWIFWPGECPLLSPEDRDNYEQPRHNLYMISVILVFNDRRHCVVHKN